jgi:FlaA1/EpsC-like NDP-sugar epimerase
VPHYIADLAQFMARQLSPDRTIPVDFTRSRPGDKETEQLWSSAESALPANLGGLLSVHSPRLADGRLQSELALLRAALDARDLPAALARLCALVPDYAPSSSVLALAGQSDPRVSL